MPPRIVAYGGTDSHGENSQESDAKHQAFERHVCAFHLLMLDDECMIISYGEPPDPIYYWY
jgi:hypothetical protein